MDDTTPPIGSTRSLAEAIATMARLRAPDGCPWDREQTFDSIKRHTLEEVYEVFDAIDRRDFAGLKDELGDLLLQVLFYAQMAGEAGYFTIEDVAANLNAKLVRRHPHIFGDASAETAADVTRTWEAIKQAERAAKVAEGTAEPTAPRYMDAVPQYLPAMLEATKLGARAAKVGFDWPSVDGLFAKIAEESQELQAELAAGTVDQNRVEDELGDLLFTAMNLARHLKVEPEFALRRANRKFRDRFNRMESAPGGLEALEAASADELDRNWQQAKQVER